MTPGSDDSARASEAVTADERLMRYLTRFPVEMVSDEEEPETIIDRYCTHDFEQWSDGLRLDRDRLIAHARPARKNVRNVHVDVHDAIVVGDRVAARYTLVASMRSGATVTNEVHLFGTLVPDGRIRRVDQITRAVPNS
jgi:hypothetical protein